MKGYGNVTNVIQQILVEQSVLQKRVFGRNFYKKRLLSTEGENIDLYSNI